MSSNNFIPFILVFPGSASTNMTQAGLASKLACRSSECIEKQVFLPLPNITLPSGANLALISKVGKSINLIANAGLLMLYKSFEKFILCAKNWNQK
jgi:hypothetical protein